MTSNLPSGMVACNTPFLIALRSVDTVIGPSEKNLLHGLFERVVRDELKHSQYVPRSKPARPKTPGGKFIDNNSPLRHAGELWGV